MGMPVRYDEDFYVWTQETAQALEEGRMTDVDVEHVAEELRDLGSSQKRELDHRLMRIIIHLLKSRYQPEKKTRSWDSTIASQREKIEILIEYNPSLRRQVGEVMPIAYARARRHASKETNLPIQHFPEACPFSEAEVLG